MSSNRDNSSQPSSMAHDTPDESRAHEPPRDPQFYFKDELSTTFLVEGVYFRVHRYFLVRESDFFRTMFELPAGSAAQEGQADSSAISLHDVTKSEFRSLLEFLYMGMHDDYTPSLMDWSNILSISTRFVCDKIRARAVKEIDAFRPRIDPVEKIVLAVRLDLPEWLAPAYEAICQRFEPLEVSKAEKLGLRTTTLLARARETVRRDPRNATSLTSNVTGNGSLFRAHGLPQSQQTFRSAPADPFEEHLPYDVTRVRIVVHEVFWPQPIGIIGRID